MLCVSSVVCEHVVDVCSVYWMYNVVCVCSECVVCVDICMCVCGMCSGCV